MLDRAAAQRTRPAGDAIARWGQHQQAYDDAWAAAWTPAMGSVRGYPDRLEDYTSRMQQRVGRSHPAVSDYAEASCPVPIARARKRCCARSTTSFVRQAGCRERR